MRFRFSTRLMEDMKQTVEMAMSKGQVVNLSVLAEQIRRRNEAENVALEDIIEHLMVHAQFLGAPMEFGGDQLN